MKTIRDEEGKFKLMHACLHLAVCDGWWLGQYPSPATFLLTLIFLPCMSLMLWCIACTRNWGEYVAGAHFSSILFPNSFNWSSILHCWLLFITGDSGVPQCGFIIILSGLLALRDVMNPSLGVMLIAEWSCATFLRFCACWIRIHLQQFTRKQQIWCTVCLVWSMTECFFSLKQFQ